MEGNNMTGQAEAGFGHDTIHTTNPSTHLSGQLATNNTFMIPFASDSQPQLGNRLQTSPAHSLSRQNSNREWKVQGPTPTTPVSPLPPSSSQLVVHIRSSASPSHPREGKQTTTGGQESLPESAIVVKQASIPLPPMQHGMEVPSIQPKKRGRPKGWKPGMSYTSAKGDGEGQTKSSEPKERADQSGDREPKRRGRRPRALAASAREQYLLSNPDYTPFFCEWKSTSGKACPAELQNMKTLRKHVFVVHGDAESLVCRWGKCADADSPTRFAEQADFEEHVNKTHFRSYVWHMGEGHQNDGISSLERDGGKPPAYLFDKNGNQITPSVEGQKIEDERQYKERKRKLKQLLIQKDENAPSEEEWTKQTLGIA
ncbi:hypothetical protein GGR52DRAFT_524870 [Hypoxylon sp. FL1284]|nr:hypothetical protein GGR52DRAFT_524870 [Hypoxylon sp. FL1284]